MTQVLVKALKGARSSISNDDIITSLRLLDDQSVAVVEEDLAADDLPLEPLNDIYAIMSTSTDQLDRPIKQFYLPGRRRYLKFLLDTGADMNILNTDTAKALGIPFSSTPVVHIIVHIIYISDTSIEPLDNDVSSVSHFT